MTKKYSDLKIIIRDHERNVPESLDTYANARLWQPLGDNHERETVDGDRILYAYAHDGSGRLTDAARASLIRRHGGLEVAYIQGAYLDDSGIQRELNKMLGIKLKRQRRR